MVEVNNNIRYEIYTDNCDGTVTVKNLERGNYFVRSVEQILNDTTLCFGFSDENTLWLKAIAEAENAE